MLPEELAYRSGDGVEVFLLWHREENRVTVVVEDFRAGGSFVILVEDDENPLDVYYHPYAYLASRGDGTRIPLEVR
jgi:hypothetical protein